jgi:hypothetical protein
MTVGNHHDNRGGWLTTISIDRVDEQHREKLRLYRQESGKAVQQTFFPMVEDEIDRKKWHFPVKTRDLSRSFEMRSGRKLN